MIKVIIFNGKKQLARINFKSLEDFNLNQPSFNKIIDQIKQTLENEGIRNEETNKLTEKIIEFIDANPDVKISQISKEFGIERNDAIKIVNLRNYIKKMLNK